MSNKTTNLQLEKPLQTETFDIDIQNRNMDTIDKLGVDYIVEYGTVDFWTWEKWASGKAICWGVTSGQIASNGYGHVTPALPTGLFAVPPVVQQTCSANERLDTTPKYCRADTTRVDAYCQCVAGVWFESHLICMGRWK